MRTLKMLALPAILLGLTLTSCSKQDQQKISNKTDSLVKKTDSSITGRETGTRDTSSRTSAGKITPTIADTSKIAPEVFREQMNKVFNEYTDVRKALYDNDSSDVIDQVTQLKKAIVDMKITSLKDDFQTKWKTSITPIDDAADEIAEAKDLTTQRMEFAKLTDAVYNTVKMYGLADKTIYRIHCASAMNNKGGYWLADSENDDNPYAMKDAKDKDCGEVKEAWEFD